MQLDRERGREKERKRERERESILQSIYIKKYIDSEIADQKQKNGLSLNYVSVNPVTNNECK